MDFSINSKWQGDDFSLSYFGRFCKKCEKNFYRFRWNDRNSRFIYFLKINYLRDLDCNRYYLKYL